MKKTVIGILAHVDAGKTTLTESMLYLSKTIRHFGRVDHKDTFLDFDNQERQRGITIFSKQTSFTWNDSIITIIDTPGHVDFSAEMERTLQILDYAILVVSGIDGVQVHTETIWKLLRQYNLPTFIFINKMDAFQADKNKLLAEIKSKLSPACYDFNLIFDDYEEIALNDEEILEYYLLHNTLSDEIITKEIATRRLFPCFFGSALKLQGVQDFLNQFTRYIKEKKYPQEFSAQVYKISHDLQGNRLTHLKITGGSLKNKTLLENEKVDQIRIYSGLKYQTVDEVYGGDICAIKGLQKIEAGATIGQTISSYSPQLVPYMSYQLILPNDCNFSKAISDLSQLAAEDPQLYLNYDHNNKQITIKLMGEIQIEILKNIIKDRFNLDIQFSEGNIIYKETITNKIEGVGHFEPLRHYAEVHLLLEPGARNSGLQFSCQCKEDDLPMNYQRLILTHLKEKDHLGVLTGSPITDMKITIVAGRAHQKHTEGGDFREATYRALRHGLKRANSILLEPYYQFTLTVPANNLSKAIYDLSAMDATFTFPDHYDQFVAIKGQGPVRKMQNYQTKVVSYTKGLGKFNCQLKGYFRCSDEEKIINEIGYNSDNDLENPTGSIFCSHGAGFYVNYQDVEKYMHIPYSCIKEQSKVVPSTKKIVNFKDDDTELENIFIQTYGPVKTRKANIFKKESNKSTKTFQVKKECLLVDGYNVIHAWPELKKLAKDNLDAARFKLIDIMCNYQGYRNCILILVFDAYKVKDNLGSIKKYHNIYIVYTKEAQTADMYIERTTHELANKYNITVATSDALEQLIVLGQGAKRISSRELKLEVDYIEKEKLAEFKRKEKRGYNYLLSDIKKIK